MTERSCNTCANKSHSGRLDDVPASCWPCSQLDGLPNWRPIELVPMEPEAPEWPPQPVAEPAVLRRITVLDGQPVNAPGLGQNVTNPALDQKASNPKDAVGSSKLPLDLVPDTLPVFAAVSFAEGASKYGAYNWRVAGVRASIYRAALQRHLAKWWNGEDTDQETGVPHLASVIACAGIILDAEACGKLNDDRPPAMDLASVIAGATTQVAAVRALNAACKPVHNTQALLVNRSV